MTVQRKEKQAGSATSPAKAWVRALERTAPIARNPQRILPAVIEELAGQFGDSPALLSDRESLTYRQLAERSNRWARWALEQGLEKGQAVGLLMPNRPEYLAIWLGITKVGGVVALLNTNLDGSALAHSINIVAPKHLVVAGELSDALTTALPYIAASPTIWSHGEGSATFPHIDREIDRFAGGPLSEADRRPITIDDRALYIYTSGTTGLPKAANVSHGRLMQSSHWFAGMIDTQPADRMYTCLPMYHIVGGVQVPGAILAGGGSVVIGEKFSARKFWHDVVRWECTLIQYIGELCRYLLHTGPVPEEQQHRMRMVCGNGLSPDIWDQFKNRFQIPRIFEFYGATEGNVSLFNIEGETGAIGRIPSYLAHRFPTALVKVDADSNQPLRNAQGLCLRCAPNEVGEAIGQLQNDPSNMGSRFDGYTNQKATEEKILRDVFHPGDAWFRTGDLMRCDERGFFFFVDRMGDTFRWKGENVATSEVAQALCAFPGVQQATVYGVAIPGTDGRPGMATLLADDHLDLGALRQHLIRSLPHYARPLFLRIGNAMELTGTFKYRKADLLRDAYNPTATTDVVYFNHAERAEFVRIDKALYNQIQTGQIDWRGRSTTQGSHGGSDNRLAECARTLG